MHDQVNITKMITEADEARNLKDAIPYSLFSSIMPCLPKRPIISIYFYAIGFSMITLFM
jgi:hypothetical protein